MTVVAMCGARVQTNLVDGSLPRCRRCQRCSHALTLLRRSEAPCWGRPGAFGRRQGAGGLAVPLAAQIAGRRQEKRTWRVGGSCVCVDSVWTLSNERDTHCVGHWVGGLGVPRSVAILAIGRGPRSRTVCPALPSLVVVGRWFGCAACHPMPADAKKKGHGGWVGHACA
eukprot:4040735-Amphidinium_carterae.1